MTETEFVRFVAKSKREIIYFIANNKKNTNLKFKNCNF